MKIKILSLITLISFAGSIESKNHKSKTEQEEASETSKKGLIRKVSDWIENRTASEIIKAGAAVGFLAVASNLCILEAFKDTTPAMIIWKDKNGNIIKTDSNPWYLCSAKQKTILALLVTGFSTVFHSLLFTSTRYANSRLRKWYGINDPKKEIPEQNTII